MIDFFERNWRSLLFIICTGLVVRYLVYREDKEKKKKHDNDVQKKTEENQKDKK